MNQIIGVLWKREKDGKEYYSGVLNDLRGKINIAVFPNNRKEADNQPDMNIVISWVNPGDKKEEITTESDSTTTKKKTTRKKKSEDDSEGDLPF
jgi:uncharacterized protein (DUF736 family)